MKTFFLFLIASTAVLAAPVDKTEELISGAMQYNFDACNRENIAEVMDSCSQEMPDRERFKRETERTFKEKDIHY